MPSTPHVHQTRTPNDPGTRAPLVLTCSAGLLTLWVLLYPFQLEGHPVTPWLEGTWIGKIDTFTNIILFIPFGLAAGWLARSIWPNRSPAPAIIGIGLTGTCMSLFAETLQVWMIERQSALPDLATNTIGTLIGALLGCWYAPKLTRRWKALRQWLAPRPTAQRTLALLAVVFVCRTWPFDLWPEKFYLRMQLLDSIRRGSSFQAWRAWQLGVGSAYDAWVEVIGTGITFLLFAAVSLAIGRAIRETASKLGDRSQPVGSIIFVSICLVIGTELLQWPIRGRTMDLMDVVAGVAGVITGIVVDWFLRYRDGDATAAEQLDRGHRAAARGMLLRASFVLTGMLLYVSVVPLTPVQVDFTDAVNTFMHKMLDFQSTRIGRIDFPLNVMAFGALAFCWMGAAGTVTRSRPAWIFLNVLVWFVVVGLGASMEFAQVYFPPRQPNAYDVVAHGIGAAAALGLWWIGGVRLLEPVARALSTRGPGLIRPLLQIYLVAYLFYAIMPLDFVMSLGEFRYKLTQHQVRLVPFAHDFDRTFVETWKMLRDTILAIPLGALLALGLRRSRTIQRPLLLAAVVLTAIELFHLTLLSRVTATTDIVIGMLGVIAGYQLVKKWPDQTNWPARRYASATAVYALVVAAIHALPFYFDFTRLDRESINEYLHHIPFAPLHFSPPFPALDDVLFAVLLALPLGALLRAWQLRSGNPLARSRIGAGAALALVAVWYALMGLMQLAIPARDPEMTELVSALLGAWAGIAITRRAMPELVGQPPQVSN